MKRISFVGASLQRIKEFPQAAKHEAGYQLDRVQRGLEPANYKAMKSIGVGVKEIRISGFGQYRIIYIVQIKNMVHVLHAFQKKSRRTSQQDIQQAKQALKTLNRYSSKESK